jgi:hypothetical protein
MAAPQSPLARGLRRQVTSEPVSIRPIENCVLLIPIKISPVSENTEAADEPANDDARSQEGDYIQVTGIPNTAAKILYRYLVKDDSGDIIDKKESVDPIIVKVDDKATGLTEQTVLEVLTTQKVTTTLDRVERRDPPHTVLKIHSVHLINAIRQVIRYYPGLNLSGVPVTIAEPFMPLVHYMKELEDYKTNHPPCHDEDITLITNSHIDILLGFLDQRLGQELRLERERHLRQPPVATYEFLWLLFRPGDETFVRFSDKKDDDGTERHPYRIAVMRDRGENFNRNYFFLIWRIDIRVTSLGPYYEIRDIRPFEGEKEILSLDLCPLDFLPNYSQAKEKLINRGMKFVSLFEPSYMEHAGTLPGLSSVEVCLSPP